MFLWIVNIDINTTDLEFKKEEIMSKCELRHVVLFEDNCLKSLEKRINEDVYQRWEDDWALESTVITNCTHDSIYPLVATLTFVEVTSDDPS